MGALPKDGEASTVTHRFSFHLSRAVALLEVLDHCYERPGGDRCRVEGVDEGGVGALLLPVSDHEAPSLIVGGVAARDHLPELPLRRHPRLKVVLLRSDDPDVARAYVHDAVVQPYVLEYRLGVREELLVDLPALLRL